ncbi:organic cation transporter protein-like [Mya arenaria]|uniref:organic cation transporter protein-like n=1 Tax=Mya arenaria TaxID=6604 RepID=UPI0022E96800|nr:organic cation transporter protein-like [Mya arenaria]XP_052794710.1 organic cation transporter protein-like [Mya arenaria]XP_052794711.1 organic cation transporter protein-like [Mya arenaria]
MSEYEDILRKIGSFGPYQRRAFILVSMFETPLAWAMLTPILLNFKPNWYCYDWPAVQAFLLKDNLTGYQLEDAQAITSLDSYEVYQYYHSNYSAYINLTNFRTENTCGPDNEVCPGLVFQEGISSIVSQWKLVCNQEILADTITSIQMAGVLIGAVLTGQLADLFGRRHILFIEHAILVIMWFCSAFAGSWEVYAGLRFVIGALIGGVLVVNFVLPLELVTPEWRTFCGCIGLWAVGLMALALWGYLISDWQYLVIGTSTASLFILMSWWFVPESPRWLLSKGRIKKAERILTAMAKYNNKPVPDFSELRNYANAEMHRREQGQNYSYWHLCSSVKATKNAVILMYGWFVSSAVYYGMNFNTKNLTGNLYLNIFYSGLVEIPALLFVVCVHNKLGRRLTVSLLMCIAGFFSFSILILDLTAGLENLPTLTIVFAMIGKAGISGGWAALQVFSAELFPTVVRNMGVGACSFSARIGAIVAPQIVFLGGQDAAALPFTVFGIISLIAGGLVWLLPETRGVPLQDELIIRRPSEMLTASPQDTVDNGETDAAIPLQSFHSIEQNGEHTLQAT